MSLIQFKSSAVLDGIKSAKEGKQIYMDGIKATITLDRKCTIDYVFRSPSKGENFYEYVEKVVPEEIKHYWLSNLEAYIKGKTFCDGTQLESMTWLSTGQIETIRSAGIGSVEALANVSEGVLEPFGIDGADLRKKAQAWLEDKSGQTIAQLEQQSQTISQLKEEREAQTKELEDLKKEIEVLKASAKPTTGFPQAKASGIAKK